jgi:hypothetical protein
LCDATIDFVAAGQRPSEPAPEIARPSGFNIEEKRETFFIIACIKALTLKMGAVQYWLEHAGLFFGNRGTASL